MAGNLKLDPTTHDIIINRGTEKVGGVDYVAQLVKTNLLFLLGEWDLDETLGIDWYNMMGKNYDLSIIQGIVTQAIVDTQGVTDITSVDITIDRPTRILTMTYTGIADGSIFTDSADVNI